MNSTDLYSHKVFNPEDRSINNPGYAIGIAVLALFILGLAVRLYDLTDQPIDFHPTRQLRGAIIARGMYYEMSSKVNSLEREKAISFWNSTGQYEPPILERAVALTYLLLGGEKLWVSRIFTTLFWLVGGAALFAIAMRISNYSLQDTYHISRQTIVYGSALVALAYYLILPFGVQASRSFQPDPGMVMWILLSIYALYRWGEHQQWKWAIFMGLFAGIAVLTKVVSVYILAGAAIAVVLHSLGIKKASRNLQVWAMAVLMVAPSVVYYLGKGGRASEYISSWTFSLSHLLAQPSFYIRWLNLIQNLMGLVVILLALTGVVISRSQNRTFFTGMWAGYLVYGLTLPYQMYTHNYYHLQLIPVIALSLVPVVGVLLARVVNQSWLWQAVMGLVAAGILVFTAWTAVLPQYAENHRNEPAYWQEIASNLPSSGKILALTQDYGYRLMYYGWQKVSLWPNRGEHKLMGLRGSEKDFEIFFQKHSVDKSFFVVTAFSQFNDQPVLRQYLYDHFPILAEGNGYLIFDLRSSAE